MGAPRLTLDVGTRRRGSTLVGGTPLRIMRLGPRGAAILDAELAGDPSPDPAVAPVLARRLRAAGLAHPVPREAAPGSDRVAVVVPVHDDPGGVASLVGLGGLDGCADVVVVDDGSSPGCEPDVACRTIRNDVPLGPGAARNVGWRATTAPFVAFVDADVSVSGDRVGRLTASFADDDVVAVAPRVRAAPGASTIDRYEAHRSPLDMGPDQAIVRPGSRVPYVPAAVLVVRRSALEAAGGFDESLRHGEDVDLVWRLGGSGLVLYRPDVVVTHRNRGTWSALARQRASYGSAAAALERRHSGAAAPLVLDRWSAVAWGLAVAPARHGLRAAAVVAAGSTAALAFRLRGRLPAPVCEATRIAGLGHLVAGRWIIEALRRAWWPVVVVGAPWSRRLRRVAAAAAVAPPALSWIRRRPDVGPARWWAACALDDGAYCYGVWRGCLRERSFRALLPRLNSTGRSR